jgi:hypothetical protein
LPHAQWFSAGSIRALSSAVALNVDLETTLTVWAAAAYDYLRHRVPGYESVTPDTIWRRFISTSGKITIEPHQITCRLKSRTYSPVMRSADPRRSRSHGGTNATYASNSPSPPHPAHDRTWCQFRCLGIRVSAHPPQNRSRMTGNQATGPDDDDADSPTVAELVTLRAASRALQTLHHSPSARQRPQTIRVPDPHARRRR